MDTLIESFALLNKGCDDKFESHFTYSYGNDLFR